MSENIKQIVRLVKVNSLSGNLKKVAERKNTHTGKTSLFS